MQRPLQAVKTSGEREWVKALLRFYRPRQRVRLGRGDFYVGKSCFPEKESFPCDFCLCCVAARTKIGESGVGFCGFARAKLPQLKLKFETRRPAGGGDAPSSTSLSRILFRQPEAARHAAAAFVMRSFAPWKKTPAFSPRSAGKNISRRLLQRRKKYEARKEAAGKDRAHGRRDGLDRFAGDKNGPAGQLYGRWQPSARKTGARCGRPVSKGRASAMATGLYCLLRQNRCGWASGDARQAMRPGAVP